MLLLTTKQRLHITSLTQHGSKLPYTLSSPSQRESRCPRTGSSTTLTAHAFCRDVKSCLLQNTLLLREPVSSGSQVKSEVLGPQSVAKINRHLMTLINLGHDRIPHRACPYLAGTSFHRLSTWVWFSKHHIQVLQKMLMGTSQMGKHRHTREKPSALSLCHTQTHVPIWRRYLWTSQACSDTCCMKRLWWRWAAA